MPELIQPIASIRNSVCAILRIHLKREKYKKRGQVRREFEIALVGSALCVVRNRFLLTAYHALNGGKPRDPNDKFHVFTVPDNGPKAYQFPVFGFFLEDGALDFAILELGPPVTHGQEIPQAAITFRNLPDGTRVLTYGFPSPEVAEARVDENGNWQGGKFFLKGHANEGIISAQYELNGLIFYELNVGWHHGESGGPIVQPGEPVTAFALMQHYRNVQTPHGIMAGPHRGRSLSALENSLRQIGATIV